MRNNNRQNGNQRTNRVESNKKDERQSNVRRSNQQSKREKDKNKSVNGNKSANKPSRTSRPNQSNPSKAKEKEVLRRPLLLAQYMQEDFQLGKIKQRNDEFYIDSITGKRQNHVSYWSPLSITLARCVTNLTSKIKDERLVPIKTDAELAKEFLATQIEPPVNRRILSLVRNTFDNYFDGFDYDEVYRQARSITRRKTVTQGSNTPQNLAPVYIGDQWNTDLIVGMKAGDDRFSPDFNPSTVLKAVADGEYMTVPKNYKSNRSITKSSAELIDEQDVVSAALRDYATNKSHKYAHIIQFDDQSIQHSFLIEGYATIDLSSASDRVYKKVIKAVWPDFYDRFEYLLPKTILMPNGKIHNLTCVGTQGFPLTFTIMSILVGLIVQSVKFSTKRSANYGDDIVIPQEDFEEVYTALEALGLKVNISKSFTSDQGFLESCGMDVMFTGTGPREITPVYLRGVKDVHFIQFFHQMCDRELMDADTAMRYMDRLKVEYFAFDHPFQITEFHFPHGKVTNVGPLKDFNYDNSRYEVSVPTMEFVVDSIRGLSKKDSEYTLELMRINAKLKEPNTYEEYVRGSSNVARPYRLMAIQDHKLYKLYIALNNAEAHNYASFVILAKEYNVPLKSILYYVFITSEMQKYKYSTRTVEFNSIETAQFDIQELIKETLGIVQETVYPIFWYKSVKTTKRIEHPLSSLHLKTM